jgi:hypothetical protein
MSVVASVNFQIIGRGTVTLGSGEVINGPYWNTITINAPETPYVEFSAGPPQPAGWTFVAWGGGVSSVGEFTLGRLPISIDTSGEYYALAVFAEGQISTPTLCLNQACYSTATSAPPEPTHESIRIANRVRACTLTVPPSGPIYNPTETITQTVCGPVVTPVQRWVRQTAAQNTPPEWLARTAVIEQTTCTSDSDQNQYIISSWLDASNLNSTSFTVFSLDVSGAQRWRSDFDLRIFREGINYILSDTSIAILRDPATDRVFIVMAAVDSTLQELSFHFYSLSASNGFVLAERVYPGGTFTGLTYPALALTTDGVGTLYLASWAAETVFVRSVLTNITFDTVEYWAGLMNTAAEPLAATCYGMQYDASGYLYLTLASKETIQGGTRILSPFDPLENTILVKLTATSIGVVWAYQDPALNVAGRSDRSSLISMPDHSIRVLYSQIDPSDNTLTTGFAHLSGTGALVSRLDIPEFIGLFIDSCILCKTPASERLFFMCTVADENLPVAFGELSFAGEVLWFNRSATYNPVGSGTLSSSGATATNRHFWIAYLSTGAIQDQVQTNTFGYDAVAVQFALTECFTITETFCLCSPRRPAQDFRTVHHRTERERILREAVRCPLHFHNRDTGGLCTEQHRGVHHGTATSPYAITRQRPFHRIGGIEEICRPVRGVSGSELTARIRSRTETSNANLRRHSEHFRTLPPPPARLCPPPRPVPAPGVPIAPVTPCVLGNQRVDYSAPTK